MSSASGTGPAGGSASTASSRPRRADLGTGGVEEPAPRDRDEPALRDRAADRPARFPARGPAPPARHPRPTRSPLRAGRGRRSPRARAPAAATSFTRSIAGGWVRNGRTSSHSWIGSPPGPGAADSSPGELDRAVPGLHVDDHPAGDEVLRLGERAVGHRRAPLAVVPHERARRAPAPGRRRTRRVSSRRAAKSRMYWMCASTSSGVHWSIGGKSTARAGPPR